MDPLFVRKVARFAVVGGGVAAVFMALNWLFGRRMGEQAAFFAAYPPALLLHFLLNKWWTFGDRQPVHRRQVGEYLLMVLVTFVVQWLVFTSLTRLTPMPGWLASGVANAAQMAITFLGLWRRIFADRGAAAP